MMVHLASGFAERGFQADPVLADALGLSGVRTQDEKCADLEASASKPGIADAVSPPGFSRLSAALLASLTAPTDPALRAGALDFSEEKIIPQYLEVLLPRQGAADG